MADVVLAVLFMVFALAFIIGGFKFVVPRWVHTFLAAGELWKDYK